jgi:hypothetical protein
MKETLEATLRHEPPLPNSIRPFIPPLLETTIMKLLAKDPSERLANAAELVATLRRMTAERRFTLNPHMNRMPHSARRADPMYVPTVSLAKADA